MGRKFSEETKKHEHGGEYTSTITVMNPHL
jgi:hypothetical protein